MYDTFIEGAKEGLSTVIRIFPYMVAMFVAIRNLPILWGHGYSGEANISYYRSYRDTRRGSALGLYEAYIRYSLDGVLGEPL